MKKYMTAYEFTRMESDFTKKVDISSANPVKIQRWIDERSEKIRKNKEYCKARDLFMELTMSCDNSERIGWMNYWMNNAIAYGAYMQSGNWLYFYAAAYEIKKGISHYL